MPDNFLPDWQRLLIARSEPVAAQPAVLATYWFPVLEAAITEFRNAGGTAQEQNALTLADQRVQAGTLRLTYQQLVGETLPWTPVAPAAMTWHDSLPRGLLVLVDPAFNAVGTVPVTGGTVDQGWANLKTLLELISSLITADNQWSKPWVNRLGVTLNLRGQHPGGAGRLLCWSAIDYSDTTLGRWVVPGLMDTATVAKATLQVPISMVGELPPVGKSGSAFVDDPISMTMLTRDLKFKVQAQTQEVSLDLPWFTGSPDELSLAAALLDSYRFSTAPGAPVEDQVSLWDVALTLDPAADQQAAMSQQLGDWPTAIAMRRQAFRDRLNTLRDRGIGGFAQLSAEALITACWVRRLSQIVHAGLAYPGADSQKPITSVDAARVPKKSNIPPAATDEAADTAFQALASIEAIESPLECAAYLAMRFGSVISSSSARSLKLMEEADTTLGVASLLESPEIVYTDIARQIAAHFSIAGKSDRITGLSTWLGQNAASDRETVRTPVALGIEDLGEMPIELAEQGQQKRSIAQISVSGATSALKSPSSQIALVKAMVGAFERPPVGGMPTFVADLVSRGFKVRASAYSEPKEEPHHGEAPPPGLVALLSRGFDRRVAGWIHARASLRGVATPRGARDIVRMGRGAFISGFVDGADEAKPGLSRDLLSQVYSRAWNKVSVRAQFVARLRPAEPPVRPAETTDGKPHSTPALPDLATLFNLRELPSCSWGESIHGPAAYLADILEFLRHRRLIATATPDEGDEPEAISALNLLLQRRPDLAEIDLNDRNATVEMPFIDLVNEVLEGHLTGARAFDLDVDLDWSPGAGALQERHVQALQTPLEPWGIHLAVPVMASGIPQTALADRNCRTEEWMLRDRHGVAIRLQRHLKKKKPSGPWQARLVPQTTLAAEALAAEPQYVERRAYQGLATQTVAGSYALPWSMGEAVLEGWLGRVEVTAAEVLRASRPDREMADARQWLPRALADLGIPQTVGTTCIFHGGPDHLLFDSALDRGDRPGLSLQLFLERSGLSFSEAVLLTETHAGRSIGLKISGDPGNPCSADTREIRVDCNVSDGFSRLARLLRLRRYLGWSLTDLDLAWSAPNLGNQALAPSFACQLALLTAAAGRLQLPIVTALRIFTRLRTTAVGGAAEGDWARIFLNPRSNGADVFRDEVPLRVLKILSGSQDSTLKQLLVDVEDGRHTAIRDRLQTLIAASVGVAAADLQALTKVRHPGLDNWTDCTREMLSQIFGAAVLMRALGVTPAGLGSLVSLSKGEPFVEPAAALWMLDLRQQLEAAGLSAATLQACLTRDPAEPVQGPTAPALYRPASVMGSVLAIFRALREGSAAEDAAGLLPASPAESEALPVWLRYLEETGAALAPDAPWTTRLNLLREPVRRLLPLIRSDLPRLRKEQIRLYPMADYESCAAPLLVDALGTVDVLLDQPPKHVPAEPLAPIKDGQDLLHPDTRKWIRGVFAPVLQWIGLTREETLARLSPWLATDSDADATRRGMSNPIAAATDALAAVQLASFLVGRPLVHFALRRTRQSIIAEALAAEISATPELAWTLLEAVHPGSADDAGAAGWWLAFDAHRAAAAWEGPIALALEQMSSVEALQTAFAHTLAVHRSWCVMGGLGLTAPDVHWLSQRPSPSTTACRGTMLGALVPQDLLDPPRATEPDRRVELADRWCRLAAWAKAFARLADVENPLAPERPWSLRDGVLEPLLQAPRIESVDPAVWAAIDESLERVGGWSAPGVVRLVSRDHARALLLPETYSWLTQADLILVRTGATPEQLISMANALASTNEESRLSAGASLRSSVRRRFADEQWLTASKLLNNQLRGSRRNALVESLLARTGQPWSSLEGSKDRLYEYLLLDTQMASCMTTSRIVQAHAAIQQFAQRCTMGLEAGWTIPVAELEDWKQWTWMRNYRVWEACRKIFLYPENWMEPEIRDDKSAFFEELESELNQGELTDENAERAMVRYLHKLHDVARLQVLATYYQFDADQPVMHILGRTPSQPYRYFYRQWIDERSWTPWEPVDLEIEGSQVVFFRRGGRLYLGWMTATHEELPPKKPSSVTTTQTGNTYTVQGAEEATVRWKLQLTTSQRTRDGWESKRTGQGNLVWPAAFQTIANLTTDYRAESLQLVFQDFGVPEILVLSVGQDDTEAADRRTNADKTLVGSFSLASCLGIAVPESPPAGSVANPRIYPMVGGARFEGFRYVEGPTRTDADLRLVEGASRADIAPSAKGVPSLLKEFVAGMDQTPGRFSVTIASQASLLDLALATARAALVQSSLPMTMGLGLPIFYSDEAVDLAARINFKRDDDVGGNAPVLSSRTVARVFGGLRLAVESDAVQQAVWASDTRDDAWAGSVLKAVQTASPAASPSSIYGVVKSASDDYPQTPGDRTFELAARTHHPVACELVSRAEGRGVTGIFSQRVQMQPSSEVYRGRSATWLSPSAVARFPEFAISFDPERDAYACYNWEVFFHAPFLIAMKFASEGKFEEAVKWFHCIFDPIGVPDVPDSVDPPRRSYWKTQPFRTDARGTPASQNIDVLLDPDAWDPDHKAAALQDLVDAVMEWRHRPNLPFQVARGRWSAFQKAVVYRYIDTIIAWGDARFRIDTREEITAASQLYVLAGRLLGRRPRTDVSLCGRSAGDATCGELNYEQLQELIDRRDDALSTQLDVLFSDFTDLLDCRENEEPDSPHLNFYNEYFCIPPNEKLFELWDRVADRQYKVRNCLNIDGVYRIPSLFAPPIDPALLARAGAAGLSMDQILTGLNQPRSHYRFSVMLQKANEVASELRTLGGELLQALEKRDAEELTLLRSRLDLQLTRMSRETREAQIKEAETQLKALVAQHNTAVNRSRWYVERLARDVSPKESESIEGIRSGLLVRTRVAAMKSTAAVASMIPKFTAGANGAFGSPHFALTISGELVANAQNFFADKLAVEGDKDQTAAGITGTLASYERRREEWEFQRDLANGDIAGLVEQIRAAEIRRDIAMDERRNLEKSIENAEASEEFLKSKFSNAGLYDWMVRQTSLVYYKTYQMAADYARAAEDCLNRELPVTASGVRVIRNDHWNGLRKGLLAASSLIHDLKRLEAEQISRNKRLPELTKHVSLAVIDPIALLQLRSRGVCTFKIPEALFDLDHPGQFARRVKSVALSVPCISGPFSAVNCSLSLTGSDIRREEGSGPEGLERVQQPVETVFTSSGSSDTGLWEPNLRDERYLPFEGAGAVNSEWTVSFPRTVRQFDYASISDLVLQIRYTAEPCSNSEAAEGKLATLLSAASGNVNIKVFTSLRDDLADQFNALVNGTAGTPVRLRLPTGLARWLGRPVTPSGGLKVVVLGEGSGAPAVSVADVKGDLLVEPGTEGPYSFRAATLNVAPKALFAPEGFDFLLAGMGPVKDVLLYIDGVAAPV